VNENYQKILELCKVMIERDYAPCGLEDDIKKRLLGLTLEIERRNEKASKEGKATRGFNIIFSDVLRAVNLAEQNAKRFGKPKCYYLRQGLQIPPCQPGGLGHWALSFRQQ